MPTKQFTNKLEAAREYMCTLTAYAGLHCTDVEVTALALHGAAKIVLRVVLEGSSPEDRRRILSMIQQLSAEVELGASKEAAS